MGTVDVHYASVENLTIAYSDQGSGLPAILHVPGFVSHAELMWESPVYRYRVEYLRRLGRFVTFDKRGTGLSDRTVGFGTAEERMHDLLAVLDATGIERASIIAISEGGPLALLFAATYPERVESLVLWGTYGRGLLRSGLIEEQLATEFVDLLCDTWGSGEAIRMFVSGMPTDSETTDALARFERNSATPRLVREIMTSNLRLDVSDAIGSVPHRTLVVHRAEDPIVPVVEGEFLADRLPDAALLPLPGSFHLSGAPGAEDDALDAIAEFLVGSRPAPGADRALRTVLFTDIVDSTTTAARLGDAPWHRLLDLHDDVVRRALATFEGRAVNTTGDGFLASFDGPVRAIRCARAIQRELRQHGLSVRAGIHTGECELRGDDLAGIAVHLGARVGALAGPDEVLVTSTVRDLTLGSGIDFEDRGQRTLKGIPGDWTILAVAG